MRDKKFKGVPQLADLGDRIVVVGASNSGKSTLAHQIGEALDMPVVHLDQLFHEPNQRCQMAKAAQSRGCPEASNTIARDLLALAEAN